MVAHKNYNIRIKGRVQDIGFRTLVENIGRSLNLRGVVYNDIDGTVEIVCGGAVASVRSLVKELKDKSANVGATIDEINQEEISGKVDLPPYFFKAPTDELGDIGRKLDLGIQSIQDVERNTGAISDKMDASLDKTDALVKGQDSLVKGQDTLVKGQDSIVKGQDSLVKGQDTLVKGQDSLVKGQDTLVKGQDSLVKGQDSLIKGQNKMINILERIAEK